MQPEIPDLKYRLLNVCDVGLTLGTKISAILKKQQKIIANATNA